MSLFETGKDNIINEFKENLAKHSQTIPPIAILDALANDDGSIIFLDSYLFMTFLLQFSISEEININHFSPVVKDNLIQIADWLISHNEDDFMNVCS